MAIGGIKTYPVLNIQRVSPKESKKESGQQKKDDQQENNKDEDDQQQDDGLQADGHIDEFA